MLWTALTLSFSNQLTWAKTGREEGKTHTPAPMMSIIDASLATHHSVVVDIILMISQLLHEPRPGGPRCYSRFTMKLVVLTRISRVFTQ